MTLEATWVSRDDSRAIAWRGALVALAAASLAACAGGPRPDLDTANTGGAPTSRYAGYKVGKPYQVKGVWYYPKDQPNYDEIGIASWYGEQFRNRYTADGEVFDMAMASAAHKTLPLPSLVEVTNLANGKTLVVRVNDRGPFVEGRVIDLSRAAAAELGFVGAGVTKVRVRYVGQAEAPPEPRQDLASRLPKPSLKAPPVNLSPPPVEMAALTPPAPPMALAPLGMTPLTPPPSVESLAPLAAPMAAPIVMSALTAPGPGQVSQTALAPLANSARPSYIAPPEAGPEAQALDAVAQAPAAAGRLSDVDSLLGGAGSLASTVSSAAGGLAQQVASLPVGTGIQVQAGVFSSQANAERLLSHLTGSGAPTVEPFVRNGQTLYRVVVRGVTNPSQAAAIRDQAAAFGSPGAQIITGL